MDLAYGTGLLAFDEVCKRVETLALHTEDETRTGYIDTQVIIAHRLFSMSANAIAGLSPHTRPLQKEIKNLVAQLTEAYRHRDSLWNDLDENLEKCGNKS